MTTISFKCGGTWKKPFRTCYKRVEDTLCAAARKVCQKDCSDINSDASNYIVQFNAEIQRIQSEIVTVDFSTNSEGNYLEAYKKMSQDLQDQRQQITDALKDATILFDNFTKIKAFIEANHLQNAEMQSVIQNAKDFPDPLIALLGSTLEKSQTISEVTSAFFSSNHLKKSLKNILNIFQQEIFRFDREIQNVELLQKQATFSLNT